MRPMSGSVVPIRQMQRYMSSKTSSIRCVPRSRFHLVPRRSPISQERNAMAKEITYYAIVNEFSSRQRPGGVLRRIKHDGGQRDEAFTRDLVWKRSESLHSAERGDTMNDFYRITEDEAMRIVDRIRRQSSASN